MRCTSVYRFQFNQNFTLKDATDLIPYLASLGIEGVYTSPIYEAVPGSAHCYDITSPLKIFSEIGTEDDFVHFASQLQKNNMKLLLDLVANHMSASEHNPWWMDVLAKGEESPYAKFFDIDFHPPLSDLEGKVLLPILPVPLNDAIEKGLILLRDDGIEVNGVLLPRVGDGSDLREVLSRQHYRLGFWQEAAQEINYRRFFDICGLAALRIEHEEVFHKYHKYTFDLIKRGLVTGLRIDHPDGIYDPKEYLDRLQAPFDNELYIVVEKILQRGESLPDDWPVAGTVGYEFANDLTALFIDTTTEKKFTKIYFDFIGEKYDPEEKLYRQKKNYALLYLTSEMRNLTHRLYQQFENPAFSNEELEMGIVSLFAAFPVYRTYIGSKDAILHDRDRDYIERAFIKARSREGDLREVFDALQKVFSLSDAKYLDFIMRFQQLSPPIMAKGLEDTFCYTFNRFVALNEVGGHPLDFGCTIDEFHARNIARAENWPHGLLTISTHDTKRAHDVRMRLAALSEIPDRFAKAVKQWQAINAPSNIDANTEYLLYQNLIGAWPISKDRAKEYIVKAAREAKAHTNWVHKNINYENVLRAFVDRILDEESPFLREFVPFVEKLRIIGEKNTYASLTLFLGSPGVVDVYRGMELWDFSLVDPDNRREVDFAKRAQMLSDLTLEKALAWEGDGALKLYLLSRGLRLRKQHPDLFLFGSYTPLNLGKDVVAFSRQYKEKEAIFIAAQEPSELTLPSDFTGVNIYTDEVCSRSIFLDDLGSAILFCQRGK